MGDAVPLYQVEVMAYVTAYVRGETPEAALAEARTLRGRRVELVPSETVRAGPLASLTTPHVGPDAQIWGPERGAALELVEPEEDEPAEPEPEMIGPGTTNARVADLLMSISFGAVLNAAQWGAIQEAAQRCSERGDEGED